MSVGRSSSSRAQLQTFQNSNSHMQLYFAACHFIIHCVSKKLGPPTFSTVTLKAIIGF